MPPASLHTFLTLMRIYTMLYWHVELPSQVYNLPHSPTNSTFHQDKNLCISGGSKKQAKHQVEKERETHYSKSSKNTFDKNHVTTFLVFNSLASPQKRKKLIQTLHQCDQENVRSQKQVYVLFV